MAITDNLPTSRQDYENSKAAQEISTNRNDLTKSFTQITRQLLTQAQRGIENGDIQVQTIDDLKVVDRLMQTALSLTTNDTNTPAITTDVVNIVWQKELGLPDNTKANKTEIKNKMDDLSSDDVDDLINKIADDQNKHNAEKL